jgi:hypothetical protein
MAVLKWLLLALAVVALCGCSALGNGDYAPLPGTPTAWDGLGPPPRDRTEGPVRRSVRILRPKTEIILGSLGKGTAEPTLKPYSKEWFAKQEALDRASDAALSKKMIICRGCLSPPQDLDLVARSPSPVNSSQIPETENEATGSTRTVTDRANAPVAPPLHSSALTINAVRQTVKQPDDVHASDVRWRGNRQNQRSW